MEGLLGASLLCDHHASELTQFSHAYLQPAVLAFERRAEGQPVLDRILRSLEECPKCRRRGGGERPHSVALTSGAEEGSEALVRLTCTRAEGGPWHCGYEGHVKRKLLLLGDASAAKTDVVRPLVYDALSDAWRETVGAKVMTRHETVSLPDDAADFHVVFTVWDIAGHRFADKRRMRAYFHGAKAVLAVCDLTQEKTVQELVYWLAVAERILGNPAMVIVAKGRETPDPLPISEARIFEVARNHRATLVLLPPKDEHLVEHVFHGLGEDAIRQVFGTRWRARMHA
jgi:hypothetical protein